METLAGVVLAGTGGLLIATDVNLYKGKAPIATTIFAIGLTVAYYLSLFVVLS